MFVFDNAERPAPTRSINSTSSISGSMASPVLRIRVRCPTVSPAPVQLEGCTPQTKFGEFKTKVMEALGIEESQQEGLSILSGFPPRPLDMPQDAAIGVKLSDNENVTVRLATQTTGIQQGGKWGRSSKRPKPAAAASTAPSSTRSSSRSTKPPSGSGSSSSSDPAGAPAAGKKKANGKGKKTSEKKAAASKSGGGGGGAAAGSGSSTSAGRLGGVHTLGGPLTPPTRVRTGGGGGSGGSAGRTGASAGARGSGGGGSSGSPPGQVRTLFGSPASPPAAGSSGGGGGGAAAAAAAAARRAGSAASSSPPPTSSQSSAGGGGADAVAAAVAAASGESNGGGGAGAPNRKRPRGGTGVQLKSEGDIAERLLTAVGGGGKGTADRFFRKAMKLAVDKQYDQSRADARVRAALGGWYTAEHNAVQRRLGDGESVALDISFSKGAGSKSQFTETVDRIPREQVAAVVRMIARDPESREMLKPHNFAGCSPRMFWSLVQHWGGDVPSALRLAAPDVDWAFLDTRDRKPSEKAVANAELEEAERRDAEEERAEKARAKRKRERRKRRKEGVQTDSSEDEEDQPEAVAVAPGGAANSSPGEAPVSEAAQAAAAAAAAADARRRAANAALARLTASQQRPVPAAAAAAAAGEGGGAAPMTVVPSEGAAEQGGASAEAEEEDDVEGLAEVAGEAGAGLLVAAGVRTLGQLADRDEEELARELAVLQDRQERRGDGDGAARAEGSEGAAGAPAEAERFSAEQVSEWVQSARGDELDEIMADILGEDEDVIEALEQVSVSTPRDLVRLGAFPDVLVGAVRERLGEERFASMADRVTAGAVERWRREGDRLLEQRPWLELWVHEG